jgi:hypothetical protein
MRIRRRAKVKHVVLAVLPVVGFAVPALTLGSSYSAFSGSTSNPNNSWSTITPTVTLAQTVFKGPFPYATTGSLSGFLASETVAYRLDGATAMTGSPSAVDAGGSATITALSIPSAAEGAHTVWVDGGGGSTASIGITIDTIAPVASASTSPAANGYGWNNTTPVQVTLSATDTGGTGVSQIRYTTDGSDPTVSGTTSTYTTPFNVAATTTVKYYATDVAGNTSAVGTKQVNIDAAGPTNSIVLSDVTGNAAKSTNTVYYRGASAGSFTLTNTVTDASSGALSSATAALGATTTGWTHTPSTVSTPAGGPFVSNTFSWASSTTSSPTESVTGADKSGNTVATGLTFVNDSTAPAGGTVDATGLVGTGTRYSTSTSVSVAFTTGTDGGSGLAGSGRKLWKATAPTLSNGTCGAFGGYSTLATDPASPYADTVTDQTCARYQYTVPDLVANSATYTSGDVKVDSTAPSTPTFSVSAMTNTYASGTTIYYKSNAASGSFTMTGSSTDAASGVVSYAYQALGTNWTSTAGALGVNTYAWSGAPAAPGTKTFTATNNATLTSATSSFTMTSDITAPAGAAVTYTNGLVATMSPTITLTTPTDAGSGVNAATAVLQRKQAPTTLGVCGGYTSFATIATAPATSYVDTVTNGYCYMYQYIVYDNVGNTATVTSANVLKVDYYSQVYGTAGLVSYWRMGEQSGGYDTFTGTAGNSLMPHAMDDGSTWVLRTGSEAAPIFTNGNRIRQNGASGFDIYSSAGLGTADYSVEADIYVASSVANFWPGVMGRMLASNINNANNSCYFAQADSTGWQLFSKVTGTTTQIGSYSQSLSAGTTYNLRMSMVGSSIKVFVNGVQRISVTNSAVNNTGVAGLSYWSSATGSNTVGMHIDNFAVYPLVADSKGTNTGDYWYGPVLETAGALGGNDVTTAVQFSGSSYASIPDAATLDLGDTMSAELWFKRGDAGTGLQTLLDKGSTAIKVGLISGKPTLYKSAGAGAGTIIVQHGTAITDTTWHHLVVVKNAAGTCYVYLDNVAASASGSGKTLANTSSALLIGGSSGEYFNGTVDDVSLYSTALSSVVVDEHYAAGNG